MQNTVMILSIYVNFLYCFPLGSVGQPFNRFHPHERRKFVVFGHAHDDAHDVV